MARRQVVAEVLPHNRQRLRMPQPRQLQPGLIRQGIVRQPIRARVHRTPRQRDRQRIRPRHRIRVASVDIPRQPRRRNRPYRPPVVPVLRQVQEPVADARVVAVAVVALRPNVP